MMMLVLVAMTLTASAGDKKKAQTVKTVTFNVSMHCENCQKKIEGTIGWEKGVKDLSSDTSLCLTKNPFSKQMVASRPPLSPVKQSV